MRAATPILLAWLLAGCHGPPVGPPLSGDAGAGTGGGSGTAGTGAAGTGSGGTVGAGGATAGTGGAGTAGTGAGGTGAGGTSAGRGGASASRGGAGGTGGVNVCARCETPCTDGVCDVTELRRGAGNVQLDSMAAAFDGDRIYFQVGYGNEVKSIAKQGGDEKVLYPNHDCTSCVLTVAVDDAEVFFAGQIVATTPAILAVAKGGGEARTVCTSSNALPGQLTLEGPNVYWYRQDTGLERCAKAGGGSSSPAAQSMGIVLRMAARPGGVVWANRDTGAVTRLDTGNGQTRSLGVTVNPNPSFSMGVCDVIDDGTLAYWVLCGWPHIVYVEGASNTPTELARALAGSGPGGTDQYGSIGVDGTHVYFTEAGLLNRVPKAGGAVQARGRVIDSTRAVFKGRIIGVDDNYVYLHRSGGSLYRVVK